MYHGLISNDSYAEHIENVFAHGFHHKQEGNIKVFLWNDQGNLTCEVMDNGDGFDLNKFKAEEVKSQSQHRFSGLGIKNVRERICILL